MNVPRKVSMAAGGIKHSSQHLMTFNDEYFGYGGKYALYFYKLPSLKIVDTVCQGNEVFSLIRLSPTNKTLVFILTGNKKITFVDLKTHEVVASNLRIEYPVVNAEFTCDGKKLLLCFNDAPCFQIINTDNFTSEVSPLYVIDLPHTFATFPNDPDKVVYSAKNGSVYVINLKKNDVHETLITCNPYSMRFDPLNPDNFLIITKLRKWAYCITQPKIKLVTANEREDIQLRAGDWIPCMPGHILTGDKNHGVLYIFSVASGQMVDSCTVDESGITNIQHISAKEFVIAFTSGAIGVFNVSSKKLEIKVPRAHIQTIFYGQFLPSDPQVLATAGGDCRVCFWTVPRLTHMPGIEIKENRHSLLSLAISPGGGYLVTGNMKGVVSMYSAETSQELFHIRLHSDSILCIAWHPTNPNIIATAGKDGLCNMYDLKARANLVKVSAKSEFRRCQWSRVNDGAIAIACSDGSLYVRLDGGAYYIIKGGSDALFDVAWSPFDKNLVAATDDGGNVLLFNIEEKTSKISTGHRGPARPVAWLETVRGVFMTGGYDGVLIFWNSDNFSQITRVKIHASHIYSIATHPSNPFLVATTSRDCTVRLWSVDQMFPSQKIDAMLGNDPYFSARFCPFPGASNLEKLLHRITRDGTKSVFSDDDMIHINDVIRLEKKRVQKLTSQLPRETSLIMRAKRSKKQVIEAADRALQSGNPKRYSELMFLCGEYDMALAVAPMVSFQFWQSLCLARASMDDGDSAVTYSLIAGRPKEAVEKLIKDKAYDAALLVAAALREKSFRPRTVTEAAPKSSSGDSNYIKKEFGPDDYKTYEIASKRAREFALDGYPLLAATSLLTVGDVESAVWLLLHSGEIAWAVDIAKITGCFDGKLCEIFFRYCAVNGHVHEAFKILTPKMKRKLVQMVRFDDETARNKFYQENGMKSCAEYLAEAKRAHGFAMVNFKMLAGLTNDSIVSAIDLLKRIMDRPMYDYNAAVEVVSIIRNSATQLDPTSEIYKQCIPICHYFAVYEALWKGYGDIAPKLVTVLEETVKHTNLDWIARRIPEAKMAASIAFSNVEPVAAVRLAGSYDIDTNIGLAKQVGQGTGGISVHPMTSGIVPLDLDHDIYVSILTGERITGNIFLFEDCRSMCLVPEAIKWFDVTPFSPLSTAAVLCPY